MAEFRFSNDDMVWLLGAACQLHRIPFDARLAVGQYPPPHSIDSLREALSALGLRNRLDPMPLDRLSTLSSICFVAMRLVDSEECRFVLLLHSDGERVLCISPGETEPRETSVADFGQGYAGLALRFAPEAKTLRDSDDPDIKRAPRPFGFRWFVPELKKHKTI